MFKARSSEIISMGPILFLKCYRTVMRYMNILQKVYTQDAVEHIFFCFSHRASDILQFPAIYGWNWKHYLTMKIALCVHKFLVWIIHILSHWLAQRFSTRMRREQIMKDPFLNERCFVKKQKILETATYLMRKKHFKISNILLVSFPLLAHSHRLETGWL